MKVLITGGTGFLGLQLCRFLLRRGSLTAPLAAAAQGAPSASIDEVVLLDVPAPPAATPLPRFVDADDRVRVVRADLTERDVAFGVVDTPNMAVFHLASVMSGQGEADFDLAMNVNLEGARNLLEACREQSTVLSGDRMWGADGIRLVAASSVAACPPVEDVSDTTKLLPETTYGMTKAIVELLVNDYTRRGFIDGRSARLPTIMVRPGLPNAAVTGCFSGVVREPLAGVDCVLPVDMTRPHPVSSYQNLIQGLVHLHEVDGTDVGFDRAVNMPSLRVTLEELAEGTRRAASRLGIRAGAISYERDDHLDDVVSHMVNSTDWTKAARIGLLCDESVDAIIDGYVRDYVVAEDPDLAPVDDAEALDGATEGTSRVAPARVRRRIGYIGLGAMGTGMATNLALAGGGELFDVVLCNRTVKTAHDLASDLTAENPSVSASVAYTPAEVAESCDIVFSCLLNEEATADVYFGPDGIIDGLLRRAHGMQECVIVDNATVSPETSQRCGEAVEAARGLFLDAPVSGGPLGAAEGTLAVMVGGARQVFDRCKDALHAIGDPEVVQLMGGRGAGTVTKLVNQALVGANAAAAAEALTIAEMLGVTNLRQLLFVLSRSWGHSKLLGLVGDRVVAAIDEDVASGESATTGPLTALSESRAALRNLNKDMGLVMAATTSRVGDSQHGPALRSMERAARLFAAAEQRGLGGADISVPFRMLRKREDWGFDDEE